MTKKIFILVLAALFSVNMFSGRSDLSYQEFFENFSVDNGVWTEYDLANKIELDYMYDQRLEINHWIRYEAGYVYREYPVQDFVLEYDIKITDDGGNANIIGPGFSDTLGGIWTAQNSAYAAYYAGFGGPQIDIVTFVNGILEWNIGGWGDLPNRIWISTNNTYYVRFEKSENTLKLSIFSDADRTQHIPGSPKTVTTNLVNPTFTYFYAINGSNSSPQGNWEWTSGWIDNIYVRTEQQVVECFIDIKPQACPNPINVKSKGVLPVAVLGTEDFDVTFIDPASIRLEGAAPIRHHVEDVSTPVWDPQADCDCSAGGEDGYADLVLKFDTREIVGAPGEVTDGEVLELTLTGELTDGTPIEGKDCIIVISKGKK